MDDNVLKLYDVLKKDGYTDIGTEDDFRTTIKNPENRKIAYDLLNKEGYTDIGSYDEFDSYLGSSSSVRRPDLDFKLPDIDTSLVSDRNISPPLSTQVEVDLLNAKRNPKQASNNFEDHIVDQTYTPKQETKISDITENYINKFNLTEEGKELSSNISNLESGISKKYAQDYMNSPYYKELASRYNGVELEERANEEFERLYSPRIGEVLKPYYNARDDSFQKRYGKRMREDELPFLKDAVSRQADEFSQSLDQDIKNYRSELQDAPGTVFIPASARGAAQRYGNADNKQQQDAYTSLVAAKNLIDESRDIIREAGNKGETWFLTGALRGMADKGFDVDTWTMGITDTAYNSLLLNAIEKDENGEELTTEESKLLDAATINMATHAYFSSDLGRGYKAGAVTAESIPFMLEFAVNPVSSSGSAIAKGVLKHGMKNYGLRLAGTTAGKALKTGARLGGDALAATAMTGTTGLGRVAENTYDRLVGDINIDLEDTGKISYDGRENAVGIAEAATLAFTSKFLENDSEMKGALLGPVFKSVGKALKKIPGINALSSSQIGKLYRGIKDNPQLRRIADRTQFHGAFGEYAEEVYNNLMNVAITGDMTMEEFTDLDQNIDTFLGVNLMSTLFGGIGATGLAVESYTKQRNINRFEESLSEGDYGRWMDVKQQIKNGNIEDAREFIKITLADKSLSPEEKKEEIQYMSDILKESTLQSVNAERANEQIEQDNAEIDQNSNKETGEYIEAAIIDHSTNERIPGNIIGGNMTDEKDRVMWKPKDGDPRMILKRDIDPQSIQSLPTSEVRDINAQMVRERIQAEAEQMGKYSPDIKEPEVGDSFEFDGKPYTIVQNTPEGLLAETTDSNGKPAVIPMTNQEYYDAMQSIIDTQERDTMVENETINEVLPSNEESNVSNSELMVPAAPELVQQESVTNEKPVEQESNAIPDDGKGNLLYYRVPVDRTIEDLNDGTLEPDEVDGFVAANKSEAEKLLKKYQNNPPKIGTNKAKYLEAKKAWQENVADAQSQVDYWNGVDTRLAQLREKPGDSVAEEISSIGEPVNGNELAALMLANGNLKLLQDSYQNETGFGLDESRKMFGLFASKENGGLSIEEAGELLMLADLENGTNFFDQSDPNAGRNAILDVLGSTRTRGDLISYIKNNREAFAERERQAEYNAHEKWVYDNLGMSIEEFAAYEESVVERLAEKYKDITDEELNTIFADINERDYERDRTNDERGISSIQSGSSELRNREGPIYEGTSEERPEEPAGNAEIIHKSDNSIHPLSEEERRISYQALAEEYALSLGTNDIISVITNEEFVSALNNEGIEYDGAGYAINIKGGGILIDLSKIEDENRLLYILSHELFHTFVRDRLSIEEVEGIGSLIGEDRLTEITSGYENEDAYNKVNELVSLIGSELQRRGHLDKYLNGEISIEDVDRLLNQMITNSSVLEVKPLVLKILSLNGKRRIEERQTSLDNPEGFRELGQNIQDDISNRRGYKRIGTEQQPTESGSESENRVSGRRNPEVVSLLDEAERIVKNQEILKEEATVNVKPSEAQKEAGNYKMGHVKVQGLDITIEQPKGSVRSGVDENGKQWNQAMNNTYGYIRGTKSRDGDHIDIFLGDNPNSTKVFVVDQVNPNTGAFDEHKVMIGFESIDQARDAYLSNYEEGWKGLGNITEVDMNSFQKWAMHDGRRIKPFAEYNSLDLNQNYSFNDIKDKYFEIQNVDPNRILLWKNNNGQHIVLGENAKYVSDKIGTKYIETGNLKATIIEDSELNKIKDLVRDGKKLIAAESTDPLFRDGNKAERIEKLNNSDPVVITGNEIPAGDDIKEYKKNAKAYALKLRGEYKNKDTGDDISVTAGSINELQQHDFKDVEHLQSYAAIPQIIENAIFIEELPNEDKAKHRNVDSYRYYVTGLRIGDVDYTVKMVVAVESGNRYYDHKLTQIEKGRLLEILSAIPTAGKFQDAPLSEYKDKRLFSILQNVNELSEELNTPIRIIEDLNDIYEGENRKRDAKGWYDPVTGEVVVVLPNAESVEDARATVFHEVVAHKGLREMFGKDFNTFLDNVYVNAYDKIKERILGKAWSDKIGLRESTEEYLAELAERGFDNEQERSLWQKIKEAFMEMLRKVGVNLGFELTNTELRFILQKSYENLVKSKSELSELETIRNESIANNTFMMAPNGKDTNLTEQQWLQVRTSNFKNWFGDWLSDPANASKILDENGEPMVVYHGTDTEFNEFIPNRRGLWFTQIKDRAIGYGLNRTNNNGSVLVEAFLNMKNPAESEYKDDYTYYKDMGHDGWISYMPDGRMFTIVVSNPNQVKSAISNTGDFNSNNNDIRFRSVEETSSDGSIEEYEKALNKKGFKAKEAFQDSMLSLKVLQDIIEKMSGNKLKSFENGYIAENQMSSKSAAESEKYGKELFKPLVHEIGKLMNNGATYQGILNYMMAKHGIERNNSMARREADEWFLEHLKPIEGKLNDGNITSEEFDRLKDGLQVAANERYANNTKDYSGLTALMFNITGKEEGDYTEFAKELVSNFEKEHDTKTLWKKTNAATKKTLRKGYESGMMSKDTYEYISGMYQYYIPLRGWNETTADEVYEYLTSNTSPVNSILKKTEGRTSLADDPIATIGNMAESTILQGNRNLMKQHFLNMAINHPTDLITIKEAWYENRGTVTEPKWVVSFPSIPENASAEQVSQAIKEHEELMSKLHSEGRATRKTTGLNIDYRINSRQMNEHIVQVKRNGKDYVLFVNGNPRAAQAVNGLTNPNVEENKILRGISAFNRQLAANFTTRNPAFVFSNLARDMIYSVSASLVKESPLYSARFISNIPKSLWYVGRGLRGKITNEKEFDTFFKEFIDNGGETGFTALNNVDKYKRDIRKELRKITNKTDYVKVVRVCSTVFGVMNRWAEDVSRFNAYVTSR